MFVTSYPQCKSSLKERVDWRAKASVHHLCSPVSSMSNVFHFSVDTRALEPIQDFFKLYLALLLAAIQVLDTVHSAMLCKQVTS